MSATWARIAHHLRERRWVAAATVVESREPSVAAGAMAFVAARVGGAPGAVETEETGGDLGREDLNAFAVEQGRRMLEQAVSLAGRALPARQRTRSVTWPASGPGGGEASGGTSTPGKVRLLVELMEPPPILLILGAGPDAEPLARIGGAAGFQVVVVDPRPAYARPERFPEAAEVLCTAPETLPERLLGPSSAAVIMHHNFLRDEAALRTLARHPLLYVGLLGPRARTQRLLRRLRQDGALPEDALSRVYSPVGVDLGGEGPGAIALSIVSEVMALRWGRPVPHLRDRTGPLHPDQAEPGGGLGVAARRTQDPGDPSHPVRCEAG
ncbi:XdhC family protein [Carboxydochorda subterranea]|uniref:XdhC family protein n=1 Tax=Carboxydichorda subterranea TaxID=3109565 RepID=A0ABZ1BXU4_9FIRM|nr:XdhC family protein [Limnochorda sp. L945t]WRP17371.1 XdhC family protein [Limnochorda sp. L945t]